VAGIPRIVHELNRGTIERSTGHSTGLLRKKQGVFPPFVSSSSVHVEGGKGEVLVGMGGGEGGRGGCDCMVRWWLLLAATMAGACIREAGGGQAAAAESSPLPVTRGGGGGWASSSPRPRPGHPGKRGGWLCRGSVMVLRGGWDEEERIQRKRKKEREAPVDPALGVMAIKEDKMFGIRQYRTFEERDDDGSVLKRGRVGAGAGGGGKNKAKPMWVLHKEMQAAAKRIKMKGHSGLDPEHPDKGKREEERAEEAEGGDGGVGMEEAVRIAAGDAFDVDGDGEDGPVGLEAMQAQVERAVEESQAHAQPTGEALPHAMSRKEGRILSDQARNGNATAQMLLGLCYSHGTGGYEKQPVTAVRAQSPNKLPPKSPMPLHDPWRLAHETVCGYNAHVSHQTPPRCVAQSTSGVD
jgi:hypothetical protein